MTTGSMIAKFVVGLFLLAVILIVFSSSCRQCTKMQKATPDRAGNTNEGIYAYAISKQFVKDRLRSPSTAKFPWSATETTDLGARGWRVKAYVDSQNAFGAMIRTEYTCEVKTTDGGTNWTLMNLQMGSR